MENRIIVIIVTAIVFVASALIFVILLTNQSIGQAMQGNAVLNPTIIKTSDIKVQEINMTVVNSNYKPNLIYLKLGQPVEITLDKNTRGCFRYFVIDELGINQFSDEPSDKIIFTPIKKGVFSFHCNKGLGNGTVVVS